MTALVCAAMVVPAGVLSVVTAVYISTASLMMTVAEGEGFGRGLAFLLRGECLDLDAQTLSDAKSYGCNANNVLCYTICFKLICHA